jgi:ABC-type transport system substrate-binding protein
MCGCNPGAWAASGTRRTVTCGGGTLTVTAQADIPSLDPAIAYDWTGYNTIHNLFSGLLEYKLGTLKLVPSIAAALPTISKDGLV